MNLIPWFLRRKKKTLVIANPAIWGRVCEDCGESFIQTNVEGNSYPLGCPACGNIQKVVPVPSAASSLSPKSSFQVSSRPSKTQR